MRPVSHTIYTAQQIETELSLKDSPFYTIKLGNKRGTIQTSICSKEDLLNIPGFASSNWEYLYTTREWCPIFLYVGTEEALKQFVDIESATYDMAEQNELWITPKGFPWKQPE